MRSFEIVATGTPYYTETIVGVYVNTNDVCAKRDRYRSGSIRSSNNNNNTCLKTQTCKRTAMDDVFRDTPRAVL